MKVKALFIGIFFLYGTLTYGGDHFSIEATGCYFQPTEQAFKDVYGGGMSYGVEFGVTVWRWIGLWLGGDYFSNKGESTFSKDRVELQIIPIHGGLKFQIQNSRLRPYAGAGIGYFKYEETTPFSKVDKGEIGYIGQLGCLLKVGGGLFFDFKGSYSYCGAKPKDMRANLGGLKAGVGVGVEF
ncbi:hypothetical protein AC481_00750 [miscellaneous Crenarchaeota group archaeon SMTZ-80]|nr:MAG: hypothetical protein AC481_00750 [miscellaneous Crenarchaeota group archaeon SMTZ-80]